MAKINQILKIYMLTHLTQIKLVREKLKGNELFSTDILGHSHKTQ